jgi:hypothetical protein
MPSECAPQRFKRSATRKKPLCNQLLHTNWRNERGRSAASGPSSTHRIRTRSTAQTSRAFESLILRPFYAGRRAGGVGAGRQLGDNQSNGVANSEAAHGPARRARAPRARTHRTTTPLEPGEGQTAEVRSQATGWSRMSGGGRVGRTHQQTPATRPLPNARWPEYRTANPGRQSSDRRVQPPPRPASSSCPC